MLSKTDLAKLISLDKEEINGYLELVEPAQFIEDVKDLITVYSNSGAIKQAITLLQSLCK